MFNFGFRRKTFCKLSYRSKLESREFICAEFCFLTTLFRNKFSRIFRDRNKFSQNYSSFPTSGEPSCSRRDMYLSQKPYKKFCVR